MLKRTRVLFVLALAVLAVSCKVSKPDGPLADFSASTLSGQAPLSVVFSDLSDAGDREITQWDWRFGDGGVSESQNPRHTYRTAGSFTVALTVATSAGTDTLEKVALIVVTDSNAEEGEGEGEAVFEPGLLLNELMADAQSVVVEGESEALDWIEIYNPEGERVEMEGWSLTNDRSGFATPWPFPAGAGVEPGGYLLVFTLGGAGAPAGLQTDFELGATPGYLALYDNADPPRLVSELDYPSQAADAVFGRNESGEYAPLDAPTPNAPNY